jgi:hypothetical protein
MAHDEVNAGDIALAKLTATSAVGVELKRYKVASDNGLFKRGQQFDKGSIIELDEKTASQFMENGEVQNA